MPKYGDIRADGKVFFCMQKQIQKDGSQKQYECWLSEESFNKRKIQQSIYMKNWKNKNKERQAVHYKKYREGNGKFKRAEAHKNWQKENKDKANQYTYKWRDENPGKAAEQRFLRRAKNDVIQLTKNEKMLVNEIYKLAKLCERIFNIKYHVDHVVPVSLGGSNHPSNLRVIPAQMNLEKGKKLI